MIDPPAMPPFEDIRLLRATYLRGPSVWTYRPILEVWLDLGALEDHPSDKIPGFNQRLTACLPGLAEHHCGVGERGGFIRRLEGGTWMGHVLEHVIIELLNRSGMPAEFGQTREISRRGVYRMVFRCPEETVARVALAQGHRLLMAVINGQPFDLQSAIAAIRTAIDKHHLGPGTGCIVDAAGERRIPHLRLNDVNLVQLGHGAAQRRIWTAQTDRTSVIAEGIAQDKDLAKRLLAAAGVPVPEGRIVTSPEHAWEAARAIGLPVTVKPSDGNHARGVTLELSREQDIKDAYALAEPEGSNVMVEQFIEGVEHRVLVVVGKVVAATRGETVSVHGDGRSTLRELVQTLNQDPRRGPEHEYPLDRINLESGAVRLELRRQRVTPDAVIARGQGVLLQRNGNMAIDCTGEVHPDVAWHATLAARIVGLDIAGIDMILKDVSRPMEGQGAILEVNAGPGLLMHLKPTRGVPRPVGMAIVDHLFPRPEEGAGADASGRIPIVGIAGTRESALIARLVGWLLQRSGKDTGIASSQGLFLAGRRTHPDDNANWTGAYRILTHPLAQAAVIQTTSRSILEEGLAYDRCLVGVVTDMDGHEQLADHDVLEPAKMRRVLRTQIDVVLGEGAGVLNADIGQVAELAELCDGEVVFYSLDADNPVIVAHRQDTGKNQDGGRAVLVKGRDVVLASGDREQVLGSLDALGGQRLDTPALLAAIAAAWALEIAPELIADGVRAFECGGD
jgi:cyanophycin synthetase